MSASIVKVNVRAYDSSTHEGIFKTVVLKPYKDSNIRQNDPDRESLSEQIQDTDTKYVIKWKYNLFGDTIIIPRNCILEFDGGQFLGNGTLVSSNNDTKIVNLYGYNVIAGNVQTSGTFQQFTGVYETI